MEPNPFTKQGKALSCKVRDNRGKEVRGFKTIPDRAAVKFTEKDGFKYCRSVSYVQGVFNQELLGIRYEEQERMMLSCTRSFANVKGQVCILQKCKRS